MNVTVRDARIEQGGEKGRTFRAGLLASLDANGLWPGGDTANDVSRPVLSVFAGSDQEMRSFVANLTSGRKVILGDRRSRGRGDVLEFQKSAGYEVAWQRTSVGSTATVFLPELFQLDPGMVDPRGVSFVAAPREGWLAEQEVPGADAAAAHAGRLGYTFSRDEDPSWFFRSLHSMSHYFVAMLDRRTRCPILADGRFYLQLLLAFLDAGNASLGSDSHYGGDRGQFGRKHSPTRFVSVGAAQVGIWNPIAFRATHEEVDEVLSAQTTKFFEVT